MKIAFCLDDRSGISFGGRRQSRDRAVTDRLLELCGDGKICLSPYSAKLFENSERLSVSEDFSERASDGDICFTELTAPPIEQAEELYIFRWNRHYPSDVVFDERALSAFKLIGNEDFVGNSHEKITLEIYRRI